jgi:5-methylcytosine-specific restriction endonuclease McrA
MRNDLAEDPAVIGIACALELSEDEVVGKLHRLWSWADRHTTDGCAPAITPKWVDRYVSAPGFSSAMERFHWIGFSDAGVSFPNFDRHNGQSAKTRAEATERKRLSRKNRDDGETGDQRTAIPRPFVRHVMERDRYTCVYCGTESSEKKESSNRAVMSIDHLVPATRGGANAVSNLVCACKLCNAEKNDRTPQEWGLLPTFLQPGVSYDGRFMSQESCDKFETREEKRREEKEATTPSSDDDVRACPVGTLVDLYHECMPNNPRVRVLNEARKAAIRQRWREAATMECEPFGYKTKAEGLAAWRQFFLICAESEFLTGRSKAIPGKPTFIADIEFLFSPSGFAKTLENKYHREAA